MKKVFHILFLLLTGVVTDCTLPSADPCSGIVCQNGGTCSSGLCKCSAGFTGSRCETPENQIWQLTFSDGGSSPHIQIITVVVTGFTYSGTFNEASTSPGLWMFDAIGNKCYRLKVGGFIVRDSPGDRWSFATLTGEGCGMKTAGGNVSSGVSNRNYPQANQVGGGVINLVTQSSLGTASANANWSGVKL